MAALSKEDLLKALARLGQLAAAKQQELELLLVGGGLMVLLFETRQSTRDLDVIVVPPSKASDLRELARIVAGELAWPDDWINDAAKGFLVGPLDGPVVFSAPGLRVRRPTYEQLLAMKLCAWRDDVDIVDAQRLLAEIAGDYDSVWARVEPHLQSGRELKARYAFDDLWEAMHGPH